MQSRPIATPILVFLGSITLLVVGAHFWSGLETPPAPPPTDNRRAQEWLTPRRVVRVSVAYDAEFDRDRNGKAEELIDQAFGIVNIEWQRYRGEWFEISELQLRSSGSELDASHVLGSFLLSTASEPSTIRVRIVGRQLEVYSDGRTAMPVGGLAFRGSDVVLVSAPANVTVELLAYYLFHEIGHLWEAYDIPFAGGETTYGDKSRYTFDVDAGNAEILDGSRGPSPRSTPNLAPAIISRRFAEARRLTRDAGILGRLHDLLLHEPMLSNPAWERKKRELFEAVHDDRIRRFVLDQETTPRERREETEVRRQLAAHYWRANAALSNGVAAVAEQELDAMRLLQETEANENVRILLGAVERKIRKQAK